MESDISRTHRLSKTQLPTRDVPDHDPQIGSLQSTRLHTPGEAPNGRVIVVAIKLVDEQDDAWRGAIQNQQKRCGLYIGEGNIESLCIQ